jgi:SAM-dependent methyltransferase
MLEALAVSADDTVLEFAPGMGHTARRMLARKPASYTAVDGDPAAVARLNRRLTGPNQQCVHADARDTGLPAGGFTAVYGEAFITMHTVAQKRSILREAARLTAPGGRVALHEICLVPDNIPDEDKRRVRKLLTHSILHTALPETESEWREIIRECGLTVTRFETAPMHLLEPLRFVRDEGLWGTTGFLLNLLRFPEARQRVLEMRRSMRAAQPHMRAFFALLEKPTQAKYAAADLPHAQVAPRHCSPPLAPAGARPPSSGAGP